MTIPVTCGKCGISYAAEPESSDTALCPQCESPIAATEIHDAEEVELTDDMVVTETVELADEEEPEETDEPVDETVAFLKSLEPTPDVDDGRQRCPACREMILKTAMKCRHCGYVFDSEVGYVGGPKRTELSLAEKLMYNAYRANAGRVVGFCFLMVVICAMYGLFSLTSPYADSDGPATAIVYGLFFLLWVVCTYCCSRNQLWAACLVGVLCVLDILINMASNNSFGALICGLVLVCVFNMVDKGWKLQRRGIDITRRL